jgi:hypothetical protein
MQAGGELAPSAASHSFFGMRTKDLADTLRLAVRQAQSLPGLEKVEAWLDQQAGCVEVLPLAPWKGDHLCAEPVAGAVPLYTQGFPINTTRPNRHTNASP